ncbi:MAG TPA: tRNA uridine-5-carboxymethylaminomethyl(34) synthesis GTPase MnmE, partial [Geminicoccaceae bacterium]
MTAGAFPPPAATIYAPATAPGRAAVGVVRVSGPAAADAGRRLTGREVPPPRRASLRRLTDPADGGPLDDAVVLWMPGPGTSTGEDVLELHHHGGRAVLTALLDALAGTPGLRLAEPGEFAKCAFLNGRLDLTEAEGIADLVDATTRAQARQALRQLDGVAGRLYGAWRERLLHCLAMVEAEIDFGADEAEVQEGMLARVAPQVDEVAGAVAAHLADGHRGERLRAGLAVAVVGAPNAGKSSLVNLLARRDVAIVTPIPGTTRDVIEVPLDLGGLPVTLLDTAGLRETDDPVEAVGVERARRRAAEADLRLGVLDATAPRPETVAGAEIVALNKVDLPGAGVATGGAIAISCATGEGVAELLARLAEAAGRLVSAGDEPVITR